MGSRRWLVVGIAVEAGLLTLACGSFSGNDSPNVEDAASDGTATDGRAVDGAITDAKSGDSASTFSCTTFDAASVQPPSSLKDQTCSGPLGGTGLDLANDSKNCGWCAHDCLDSQCDGAGHCKAVALSAPGTRLIGIASGSLFYYNSLDDVYAAPLGADLDASTFLGTIPDAEVFRAIYHATVADRVYVRTFGQVYTAPLGGGPLTLFHGPMGAPGMLAAGGGHVFETTQPNTFTDYKNDGTQVISLPNVLGATDVTVTPDGRNAFFVARYAGDAGFDAATDASTYQSRAEIYRYDVAKSQPSHLLDADWYGGMPTQLLVADNQFVYFAEAVSGDIKRFPVDATFPATATVVSKGNGRTVRTLTADSERLYWFQNTNAGISFTLRSTSKCGGAGELEYSSTSLYVPYPAAVAGAFIYLTTGDGDILRIAK